MIKKLGIADEQSVCDDVEMFSKNGGNRFRAGYVTFDVQRMSDKGKV